MQQMLEAQQKPDLQTSFISIRFSYRPLTRALILLTLTGIVWLRANYTQSLTRQGETPYGRSTARQMLAKAQRLCTKLVPEGGKLLLTAERFTSAGDSNRAAVHVWEVYGEAVGHSGPTIFFRWNADTDELAAATITHMPASLATRPGLNLPEAIIDAKQWLERLGFGLAERWRIVGRPRLSSLGTWSMEAADDRQRVHVVIDAATGALLAAIHEAAQHTQ